MGKDAQEIPYWVAEAMPAEFKVYYEESQGKIFQAQYKPKIGDKGGYVLTSPKIITEAILEHVDAIYAHIAGGKVKLVPRILTESEIQTLNDGKVDVGRNIVSVQIPIMDFANKTIEVAIKDEFASHKMKVESTRKLYNPDTGSFVGKWTVEFTPQEGWGAIDLVKFREVNFGKGRKGKIIPSAAFAEWHGIHTGCCKFFPSAGRGLDARYICDGSGACSTTGSSSAAYIVAKNAEKAQKRTNFTMRMEAKAKKAKEAMRE